MSGLRRKIIRGTSWAFFLRVLNAVMLLIVNVLMTRILSPEDVGLYFLVMSIVSFVTYLSSFGLHLAVVRLLAESLATGLHGHARDIVKKIMTLGVGNGALVFCLMAFGGLEMINRWFYQSDGLNRSVFLISLWVLVWAMQMNISEMFRGFNDIKLAVLFRRLFPNACFAVFLVILFVGRGEATFEAVLWGSVGSWLTSCCFSLLLSFRKTRSLNGGGGDVRYREIVNLAWPLGVTSLFTLGMKQADIWILGAVGQLDDLAAYGVSVRLLRQVVFPLFVITATIQPLMASLYAKGDLAKLQKMLRASSTIAAGIGILVFLWVLVLGEWTLSVVFGAFYASGATIFLILSVGTLFRMVDGSNQMTLMMTGNERLTMYLSAVYTAFIVAGGVFVVPTHGAVGMAWVMACTSMLRCLMHVFFLKRKTGMLILPSFNPKWIGELIRFRHSRRERCTRSRK